VRSLRFALALVATAAVASVTFQHVVADTAWRLAAALLAGGFLGALVHTAVLDGPRALLRALRRSG
jgi:hypothetical protein